MHELASSVSLGLPSGAPGKAGEGVSPKARNPRIDLLRGIAILLVLLLHFTLTYRLGDSPLTRVIPGPWLRALLINGNYGVTIFFVLSGYLITSMTLDRFGALGKVDLRTFYALRLARILPCLGLALLIIVPLGCLGLPSFRNASDGVIWSRASFVTVTSSVLTFWHNVLMARQGYFNYALNIYWSLSVEEVFYLGFPLVCATLKRQRWFLLVCALAILVGPWYRSLHREDEILFMYGHLACFDAIAFGCIAALLARRWPLAGRWATPLQIAAALLVVVTYLQGIYGHEVWGFTLIALGTAVLAWGSPSSRRGWAPLNWLGGHSYELYLFHIVVLGLLRDWIGRKHMQPGWKLPWLLLFLGLSALVAWALARFYSEPLNRGLRRRLLR